MMADSCNQHDRYTVLVASDGYRWRCRGCDLDEDWFSDDALAKQAGKIEAGFSGLLGIWEPRYQPTASERCCRCTIDNREGAGGDGHFCSIHVGRHCKIPDDCGSHGGEA